MRHTKELFLFQRAVSQFHKEVICGRNCDERSTCTSALYQRRCDWPSPFFQSFLLLSECEKNASYFFSLLGEDMENLQLHVHPVSTSIRNVEQKMHHRYIAPRYPSPPTMVPVGIAVWSRRTNEDKHIARFNFTSEPLWLKMDVKLDKRMHISKIASISSCSKSIHRIACFAEKHKFHKCFEQSIWIKPYFSFFDDTLLCQALRLGLC